jgi:hypothetical protein
LKWLFYLLKRHIPRARKKFQFNIKMRWRLSGEIAYEKMASFDAYYFSAILAIKIYQISIKLELSKPLVLHTNLPV